MRCKSIAVAMACVILFGPPVAAAPKAPGPSVERDLPPEARSAIESGLSFLANAQNTDGSWLSDGRMGRYPAAITSLCGLALLAQGSTAYGGPYAPNVRRAVEYLLRHADPETGLIGGEEAGRPMFGHGFAMLFLAEVYGSEGGAELRRRIRDVLERAVALSCRTQGEKGGWFYTPTAEDDEGSVTITQVQGLRACANAGIPVPEETIRRALEYIRASANPDGGMAYRAGVPGPSRPGITCAALATMFAAGLYDDPLVEKALRYARANVPTTAPSRAGGTHFFYSHLYLSQVMYFRGGEDWEDYFSGLRAWLLEAQNPDGSWSGDYIGRGYGTACALLILQLPYNNLPILQR